MLGNMLDPYRCEPGCKCGGTPMTKTCKEKHFEVNSNFDRFAFLYYALRRLELIDMPSIDWDDGVLDLVERLLIDKYGKTKRIFDDSYV